MATSLAVRNLTHSKVRTLVAMGGVCFAVTLLFMQLGFFASVSLTAMLVYDALDYHLLLASPHYVALTQAGTFPAARLHQARADPRVATASPLHVGRHVWRNPDTRVRRPIVVLGVRPTDPVSKLDELARQLPALSRPDTALIDRLSRADVGPQDAGVVTDVGPLNLTVVGQFTIGPGFEAGLAVVGDGTFARLFGRRPGGDVNVGLVKLRPDADPEAVAADLRRTLPPDVRVFTRPEIAAAETYYWLVTTSTGIIFATGVAVAVLFGIVITYQVLSLEVTHRLSEYATLKALGFSDANLALIVLKQAAIFAVVSYVPGFLIALGIYDFGHRLTNLPIGMTAARAVGVFVLTVVLCGLSGVLALRILRRADPVDLF
jgi:putative ABC transport system permease protein